MFGTLSSSRAALYDDVSKHMPSHLVSILAQSKYSELSGVGVMRCSVSVHVNTTVEHLMCSRSVNMREEPTHSRPPHARGIARRSHTHKHTHTRTHTETHAHLHTLMNMHMRICTHAHTRLIEMHARAGRGRCIVVISCNALEYTITSEQPSPPQPRACTESRVPRRTANTLFDLIQMHINYELASINLSRTHYVHQ